jgi:uncharacterized membrane protein YheB (UPF0754 family)
LNYKILFLPLVGALIGWFTNYIAVKMLFRPYRSINIFGIKVQGLIPKRRGEIAKSIARGIEKELLSAKDLSEVLEEIDWEDEVEKTVEEVVEHRFKAGAVRKFPVVGLVSDNLLYHIKYLLTREIVKILTHKKDSILNKFQDRIDLEDMVTSKIDRLDLFKFEGLLTSFIARELRHIEWIGGIIGFIIGSVQVAMFYLLQ